MRTKTCEFFILGLTIHPFTTPLSNVLLVQYVHRFRVANKTLVVSYAFPVGT
jgi:hypothetical protein